MIVQTLVVGALEVNCYVLGCERTLRAVVIDPGDDVRVIRAALDRHHLTLARILATHAHFDHVMAARALREETGAPFCLHPADRPVLAEMRTRSMAWMGRDPGEVPAVDENLVPSEMVRFGDEALDVRGTPGHSPGGVTFVDQKGGRAFTGDSLFAGSIGRTDLPGGDIEVLLAAIRTQILTLPDEFAVLPGHGPASTVGEERSANPFLREPSASSYWW